LPIVLARIDDRLIHGQITVSWSKLSNPDIIAVVDDEVASNEIQKSTLELATPIGIELMVLGVSEGIKELGSNSARAKKKIFLISPTPEDILRLVEGGVEVKSINVGQMGYKQGKIRISKTVSVEKRDVDAFRKLRSLGISLEQRQLPGEKKVDLEKLLPEIK
jgi:mannose/fructose/sorbose-specific phosphotransferase system IIB component